MCNISIVKEVMNSLKLFTNMNSRKFTGIPVNVLTTGPVAWEWRDKTDLHLLISVV